MTPARADLPRLRRTLISVATSRRVQALIVALAAAAADPAVATTADDLCAPNADPCRVATTVDVSPGSDIDVGTRQLLIANRGALSLTSGTMTLRAGTLTVNAGGSLLARFAGGRIIASADTIAIAGTVDASGGPGGTVTLTSTGALTISGVVDVRSRNSDAGGGSADLQGGDVTIATGARLTATGGANDSGGDVTIRAAGALLIGGDVVASGGDGGTIDASAAGSLTVAANVEVNADASATAGGGGSIDLDAIGTAVVDGELTAVGRNGTGETGGGDGGSITIVGSSIEMPHATGRIDVTAGSPDGLGGDVDLTTNTGSITLRGQILCRGPGTDGTGGTAALDAAADAMLASSIDCSAGAGGGGDVDVSSGMGVTITSGASLLVGAGSSGSGGGIDIAGNGLVAVGGMLITDGGNAQGAGGGTIDVSGCTVRIDEGGRLSSLRTGGTNTLIGRDVAIVSGTVRADPTTGRNVIRFAGSAYEPSILPGAQIDPPLALIVDAGIVPCNPVATPTVTVTTPTRTRTGAPPTVTPTAEPIRCVGDCDGSGTVTVSDLIVGVNIALGNQPVTNCPAFDANRSGTVTVNELIQGVGNALNGCPT